MHTHTCQQCGHDYDGGDTPSQVGEDRWQCDCPSPVACADCAPALYQPVCAQCDEDGVITLATEKRGDRDLCSNCAQHEDEAAHERSLSSYYGGASDQSDRERMASADRLNREGRY